MYKVIFYNTVEDSKSFYNIERETSGFVWLSNNYDKPIKVSKKTNRVWVIYPHFYFETAKANIVKRVS